RVRAGGEAKDGATQPEAVDLRHLDFAPYDWYYRGWNHWHGALNKSVEAVWRVTLAPGEEFAPTLRYHYFWHWN
ncbi:MAG: hypothetical protein FWG05_00825, partial [Kiritimatiellaeota bacterium]|nr:hypothetical protein [Kiritimatiellota bacterium]